MTATRTYKNILWLLTAICAMATPEAKAQDVFSVSDTLLHITKTTITPVAYAYSHVYNDTEEPLTLRWVKRIDNPYPEEWILYFQDPNSWFNTFSDVDSADFVLGTDTLFTDILNLQVQSNGYAGGGSLSVLVFPVNNRADSVRISYRVVITEAALSAHHQDVDIKKGPMPQPSDGRFCVKHDHIAIARVYDAGGYAAGTFPSVNGCFDMRTLASGMYILVLEDFHGAQYMHRLLLAK